MRLTLKQIEAKQRLISKNASSLHPDNEVAIAMRTLYRELERQKTRRK